MPVKLGRPRTAADDEANLACILLPRVVGTSMVFACFGMDWAENGIEAVRLSMRSPSLAMAKERRIQKPLATRPVLRATSGRL